VPTRPTPVPVTLPPEALTDEESWDDLVSGSLSSPAPPPPSSGDAEIFDRDTAIPRSPIPDLALELDLSSIPVGPPSPDDPFAAIFSRDAPLQTRTEPSPARATKQEPPAPAPQRPPAEAQTPNAPAAPTAMPRGRQSQDSAYARTAPAPRPVREFERAPTEPPDPEPKPRKRPASDRTRTIPEPMVERYLAKTNQSSLPAPPPPPPLPTSRPSKSRDDLELEFDLVAGSSPLDLVDTYQDTSATASGEASAKSEKKRPPSVRGDSTNAGDMQDRYAVGDFTGALVIAESLLEQNPENEDAKRYAQSCREVLTQMYAARIGPMEQLATVAVPPEQITWLSLDHRAGFLLSLIDGTLSIEEILDVSGMSRLDALRIMYTLVQQNVITLRQ
jgi:hypothetical protein